MQMVLNSQKRNAVQDQDLLWIALCHVRDILIILSASDLKWAKADILVLLSIALAATIATADENNLAAANRDGQLFDFVLDFVRRAIRDIEAAEMQGN